MPVQRASRGAARGDGGRPKEESMADLELQRDSAAVVIMDYQNDIVGNYSTDGDALLTPSAV